MKEVFDTIADIARPPVTMPLDAIWLPQPLQTAKEKTTRITEGHFVHVDANRKLKDVTKEDKPTHRITGCYGTVYSTDLHFSAINLKSLELIKIVIVP